MGDRDARPRPTGQHFLRPRLAADLVRNTGVTRGDLVLEIGAGTGVLTRELARRAGKVVAVEVDPSLVRRLRARKLSGVRVVCSDVLEVPLPAGPYRVVGNLPFGVSTAVLRRLFDDPVSGPLRADLIVQWGLAVKRCTCTPDASDLDAWSWTRRFRRS